MADIPAWAPTANARAWSGWPTCRHRRFVLRCSTPTPSAWPTCPTPPAQVTRFDGIGRQPYDALVTPDGRHFIAGLFGEDGLAMVDLWADQPKVRRVLAGYGRGQQPLPVYKMPHLRGWAVAGRQAYPPAIGRHEVLVADTTTLGRGGARAGAGQPVFVMARPDGRQVWVNFAVPDYHKVQVIDTPPARGGAHPSPARPCCTSSSRRAATRCGSACATTTTWWWSTPPRFRPAPRWRWTPQRHLLHRARRGWAVPDRCHARHTAMFDDTPPPAQRLAARLSAGRPALCRTGQHAGRLQRGAAALAPVGARRRLQPHWAVSGPPGGRGRRCCAPRRAATAAGRRGRPGVGAPGVNHNYEREHRFKPVVRDHRHQPAVAAGGMPIASAGQHHRPCGAAPAHALQPYRIDLAFDLPRTPWRGRRRTPPAAPMPPVAACRPAPGAWLEAGCPGAAARAQWAAGPAAPWTCGATTAAVAGRRHAPPPGRGGAPPRAGLRPNAMTVLGCARRQGRRRRARAWRAQPGVTLAYRRARATTAGAQPVCHGARTPAGGGAGGGRPGAPPGLAHQHAAAVQPRRFKQTGGRRSSRAPTAGVAMPDDTDLRLIATCTAAFRWWTRPTAVAQALGTTEPRTSRGCSVCWTPACSPFPSALFQIERAGGLSCWPRRCRPGVFDAVTAAGQRPPEVAHNYRREHALNMWFVVAATNRPRRRPRCPAAPSGATPV